jgi:tRNA dimethylallyltransferase
MKMQLPDRFSLALLVVILGPTAVGKTELAIQLAERLGGEIVSADSRLFYRGMDIGTAKPGPQELERVPHHLINVAQADEIWSLAMFQQHARQAIEEIYQRRRYPFLVGGTGQYLRAVAQGWSPPAVQPDPRLRAALEGWAAQIGYQGLHARLAVVDPQAAAAIDSRNLRRTVRALEVILSSGRLFSAQREKGPSPHRLLQIGLQRPRAELYHRIDQRIEAMLQAGWVAEVQDLLSRGYDPQLPSLSAIGYRELVQYLQGKISYAEAVMQIKRATRSFVRRQANWFKADDEQIHWFNMEPQPVEEIQNLIFDWLNSLE